MAKLAKHAYPVISAAIIIIGVIVTLIGGFGYSVAADGESSVSVVMEYGVKAADLDIKAIGAHIEAVVGEKAKDVFVSVDSYTTFPAVTARFELGTAIDGDAVVEKLRGEYPEYEISAAYLYSAEPTFTGESVSGLFGLAFIAIVVMFLCVIAVKGFKNALWMLGLMIHNVLLVLAIASIFRLPGGEYLLVSFMLTIFITVYAVVRLRDDAGNCCPIKQALPGMIITGGSFLVFAVVGAVFGAMGFVAYAVAMLLAAAVPFYSVNVFRGFN